MKINWSRDAVRDLVRLHDFVAGINPVTARRIISALHQAASLLATSPERDGVLMDLKMRKSAVSSSPGTN
jgi:plasmid stabilization system protein ParE